jgi:VRR-NUC domain
VTTLFEAYEESGIASPKPRNRRPEDALQARTVGWLRTALPPTVVWSGVEHAQKLSLRQGQMRKAKGVRSGLPDLMFWYEGRFLGVELKAAKGVQSDNQKAFQAGMLRNGFRYAVCWSEQDVEAALRDCGIPVRLPAPGPRVTSAAKPKRPSKPREPRATARGIANGAWAQRPR